MDWLCQSKVHSRSPGPPFLRCILVILWWIQVFQAYIIPRLSLVGLASQNITMFYQWICTFYSLGPGEREYTLGYPQHLYTSPPTHTPPHSVQPRVCKVTGPHIRYMVSSRPLEMSTVSAVGGVHSLLSLPAHMDYPILQQQYIRYRQAPTSSTIYHTTD